MDSEPTFYTETQIDATPAKASAWRGAVLESFAGMNHGSLRIEMPGGTVALFGSGAQELPLGVGGSATIRVARECFFRKCVLSGDIGFAESFMDGDWTSPDLVAVISWFILNVDEAPTMSGSSRMRGFALNLLRIMNKVGHVLRPNSRALAKKNISEHYDLSNDFFSLFLDPSMMYSAAKWSRKGMTLEEAQREKNDRLCRMLRLATTDHVLEIGTGWGGWALHAAKNYGCRVTTVTLSRQQFEHATRRIENAGLSGKVVVRFHDFRDIEGTFDKIVSIEMVEALGHKYLPDFCKVVDRTLKKDGLLAMQFITCPDARYEQFRTGVDFIQKHIFPGSLLLSLNRMNDCMARDAGMVLNNVEDMGPDYAITLRRWAEAFAQRTGEVNALGFDERFIRKWSYYLAYCEAAFALRNISVVQTLHTRPNNLSL
ncbi:MAG TPA: cyclopropane-fatty-acyl-phospholipid synthase family protein [Opitutaceae bacterium]|jgi:cyclopropane-fatty-acyl-phospholipid synthase|nr:cyclopropane-fatty-acyl-phospholipid synthase family protein [Opitutaceae bacterium]